MTNPIKILLLEDAPLDAELIKREFIKEGVHAELLVVRTKTGFQQALENFPANIILSDHSLPGFSSHEALKMVQAADLDVPFILITATMTDEFAVKIMKEGADDYILKDRLSRLPSAVNNAIGKFRLLREQTIERLKVNEELTSLNHRLSLAAQSANLGIWDWDIVKNVLTWDAGMHLLFDLGNTEFKSTYDAWVSTLHPDDKEHINAEIELAVDGKKKYDTEYRVIGQHNRTHTLRATGLVERNSAGKPVRMIGICWDITKRKTETLEREKLIEEMSRRNAELEQFSYIISHNLRAPVANIIGASNALTDTDQPEEDRTFYNDAVLKSANKLDHIIQDLNHILEIKDGHQTKENVFCSELVDGIKADLSDILIESGYQVTYDFLAIDELFTVRLYLQSIFLNLISNSIKYRRKDIIGCVHISSQQLDGKVVLFFEDNGMGLNLEKNKQHIFGLYKRFHTNLPGRGMGLFMVKSQVELLGGTVSVSSRENEGMKFTLQFDDSREELV
jgi:signal transduction histidine kinase/DNA-binding NarL/FixJ family response regulator